MKKLYIVLLLLLGLNVSQAQDFHLSQYDAAALNFNPAMTGMFKGQYRIHGHYRTQWSAIATKPFTTGIISFDMPVKKIAVGLQIANFRAGTGLYNVFSPMLSLAYDTKLDKNGNHHLSIGLQGGGFQKSLNYNRLTFETQFVNTNGGSFNTDLSNGETFAGNSVLIPDVNAGFVYYYAKDGVRVNPFVGAALFHINQPKESFFGADNRLPMRIVGHAGAKINLTERIQLLAKGLYMTQKEAKEMTFSLHGHFYFKDNDTYIIAGPTVRVANSVINDVDYKNLDAMIMEVGIKWKKIIYRLSYDINISSLKPTTNGRGGLEMSLTYIPIKYNPNPVKTCPRL